MKKNFQEKIGLSSLSFLVVITLGTLFFRSEEESRSQATAYFQEVTQESEGEQTTQLSENDQLTVDLVNELTERLLKQEKTDAMIREEVESGHYTVENPLVILDPYTQSPLTALICFDTEQPTRVNIHVEGEDEYTEVNHSFLELTTQHIIPVYGLYPDKLNPVVITVLDESGEKISEILIGIQTEPVSDHYSNLIILTETFQDGYQEGLNYLYEVGKVAFDKEGDIRWYCTKIDYGIVNEYNYINNHFLLTSENGLETQVFLEIDKMGKIYSSYYSSYGVHHDISPTSYGSLLITGHDPFGDTHQDFIYEIDIETGEVINTLDMKYLLQRSRPAWAFDLQGKSNRTDWLHMNSIEYDGTNGTIIISNNFQSAVVKMDWPSGDIHWIMGNHDDWNPRMQQYLLTPIGEEFEWHYNQHAAEILPDYDNNPDTIDILLFDNGTTRFAQDEELQRQIRNNEIVEPESYSRLVHYRINEITKEVEQIWQYGKEQGSLLYSRWRSNASVLNNENIIGMFSHDTGFGDFPIIQEVTREHDLIWQAEILNNTSDGSKEEYRAERLPFYFDDDAEHDIYTTARNLIPEDIMEFVENYNNSQ